MNTYSRTSAYLQNYLHATHLNALFHRYNQLELYISLPNDLFFTYVYTYCIFNIYVRTLVPTYLDPSTTRILTFQASNPNIKIQLNSIWTRVTNLDQN